MKVIYVQSNFTSVCNQNGRQGFGSWLGGSDGRARAQTSSSPLMPQAGELVGALECVHGQRLFQRSLKTKRKKT